MSRWEPRPPALLSASSTPPDSHLNELRVLQLEPASLLGAEREPDLGQKMFYSACLPCAFFFFFFRFLIKYFCKFHSDSELLHGIRHVRRRKTTLHLSPWQTSTHSADQAAHRLWDYCIFFADWCLLFYAGTLI